MKTKPNDVSGWTTSFESTIFAQLRRLAIRAVKFDPEADYHPIAVVLTNPVVGSTVY